MWSLLTLWKNLIKVYAPRPLWLVPWDPIQSSSFVMNCDKNVTNEGDGYDFTVSKLNSSWISGSTGKIQYLISHFYVTFSYLGRSSICCEIGSSWIANLHWFQWCTSFYYIKWQFLSLICIPHLIYQTSVRDKHKISYLPYTLIEGNAIVNWFVKQRSISIMDK